MAGPAPRKAGTGRVPPGERPWADGEKTRGRAKRTAEYEAG